MQETPCYSVNTRKYYFIVILIKSEGDNCFARFLCSIYFTTSFYLKGYRLKSIVIIIFINNVNSSYIKYFSFLYPIFVIYLTMSIDLFIQIFIAFLLLIFLVLCTEYVNILNINTL